MKKKVFLIIGWDNKVEQIFQRRVPAIGWVKNYCNSLPKVAAPYYWNRYRIVVGHLIFPIDKKETPK